MPSGKVHDQITVATAAASVPIWMGLSFPGGVASFAVAVAAYVFSGIWLSNDLDTGSLAYRRWGVFRFLWYPYRKFARHRSWISHGVVVGPMFRLVYFSAMVWLTASALLWGVDRYITPVTNRDAVLGGMAFAVSNFAHAHREFAPWALAGLVLGGLVHVLTDVFVSEAKKLW